MEMLKVFATYETPLPLTAQATRLRDQGWQITALTDSLKCLNGNLRLQLEPSGEDFHLLRGEATQYPSADIDALLTFLRGCADPFQLDIFEEDGRLIRRISSAD